MAPSSMLPAPRCHTMKLIVGLGNPGKRYENTRHNVGFEVLRLVASRCADGAEKDKFEGRAADVMIAGERAMLLWPHTLMNRSGQSVLAAVDFYQLPLRELFVVCDDFNLTLGTLRFRRQGSAGGQKGLQDIIHRLGTEEFSRLRIGIGPVPAGRDAADFVLNRFTPTERPVINDAIERAAEGAECWATHGIETCMNQFNRRC
jgi:peptidyl-tRNA hydrolase, PTH1 family